MFLISKYAFIYMKWTAGITWFHRENILILAQTGTQAQKVPFHGSSDPIPHGKINFTYGLNSPSLDSSNPFDPSIFPSCRKID